MEKLDWRDYGARPDVDFDSSDAINQSFADAISYGLESHGPAGTYKISQPLRWLDPTPRISGMGYRTRIRPDSTAFDALTVGTGSGGIIVPAGWVRDLDIAGPEILAPAGTTAGLRLNGATFTEVRNVTAQFCPIGFSSSTTISDRPSTTAGRYSTNAASACTSRARL